MQNINTSSANVLQRDLYQTQQSHLEERVGLDVGTQMVGPDEIPITHGEGMVYVDQSQQS